MGNFEDFGGLGSLGEFFPDQEVRCINHNCRKTWTWMRGKDDNPSQPPKKLCPSCEEKLKNLTEITVTCKAEGCDCHWHVTPKEQLYGGKKVLSGYCHECAPKFDSSPRDREVKCRINSCDKTWIWTKRDQERRPSKKAPQRLCNDCYNELSKLEDTEYDCKVSSCKNKVVYTKLSKLYDLKAGKDIDHLPPRMCKSCHEKLKTYKTEKVKCRVDECEGTWDFSAYAQLDYYQREGEDAPLPKRMCNDCYNFMNSAKTEAVQCKNSRCKKEWQYSKRMQLHDKLTGNKKGRYRMCPSCFNKLNKLEVIQKPCKNSKYGCTNTYEYKPIDQLHDDLAHKKVNHQCSECSGFLENTKTITKKCTSCDAEIKFTAYEQLLQKFGKFHPADHCSKCLDNEMSEKLKDSENSAPITHHSHVVQIPSKGAWNKDRAIAELPPYINSEKLQQLIDSDFVIVLLTDEVSYNENENETLGAILEEKLNAKYEGLKTVVVNTVIPKSSLAQAVKRYKRDVAPYNPDFIICSFDQVNSRLKEQAKGYQVANTPESIETAFEALFDKLTKTKSKAVYMTGCPVIIDYNIPETIKRYEREEWASLQKEQHDRCLAHAKSAAHKFSLPILDLCSRFEVNGQESAKKWMKNYNSPNEKGIRNIADWLANYIHGINLYDE